MTDDDLEKVIKEPKLRDCFGIVLGVNNIVSILIPTLDRMIGNSVSTSNLSLFDKLTQEIQNNINKDLDVLDNKTMPILHAFYLESLRMGMRGFSITRYSQNGMTIDNIKILPKSQVIFSFDQGATRYADELYPAAQFKPQRYLDQKYQLNEHAKLHQGLFTPFGVGVRQCPGQRIAEMIYKNYLMGFVQDVKYFTSDTINFVNPEFSEKLEKWQMQKEGDFKPKFSR